VIPKVRRMPARRWLPPTLDEPHDWPGHAWDHRTGDPGGAGSGPHPAPSPVVDPRAYDAANEPYEHHDELSHCSPSLSTRRLRGLISRSREVKSQGRLRDSATGPGLWWRTRSSRLNDAAPQAEMEVRIECPVQCGRLRLVFGLHGCHSRGLITDDLAGCYATRTRHSRR
jgi:hypothetical protein